MALIVIKVGGSLLTCPELSVRLSSLIQSLHSHQRLLIIGGGCSADVVRDWSSVHALTDEAAHWIAVRSLSVTRSLVAALIPDCVEAADLPEARRAWALGRVALLDVEGVLKDFERRHQTAALPSSWDVTSDSIAAWVAAQWSADELILAKSVDLPPQSNVAQARQSGLVDPYFPEIAQQIPRISWCNLRAAIPRVEFWVFRPGAFPANVAGRG